MLTPEQIAAMKAASASGNTRGLGNAAIDKMAVTAMKLMSPVRVAGDEWAAVRLETEIFNKEPTT